MAELHLLRPWWLLLWPIGAWLLWLLFRGQADSGGWRGLVEARLRAFVLSEPEVLRDSRLALGVTQLAWLAAIAALAGPAWERLPVPAFRSDEALVVALDMSRSMDAGDVEPSRLARAKLKLLDLLERRAAGQTALVVFTTHAFTVTPLTTDTRTIASLVGSLSSDIMPTRGGVVAAGLAKAGALLRQTGLQGGDILLITDSETDAADLDLAGELRGEGFRTHVLAVGTEQGAPIPQTGGGFVNDENGRVVIPQLPSAALERLAAEGGGRFARLTPNDRDLDALFPAAAALDVNVSLDDGETDYEADVWRDRGALLVLFVLPFLALCFRRGWLCVWLLVAWLPPPRAEALEWQDLWLRPDQRGAQALAAAEAERAAQLFENPEWRGAAQYRAGNFGGAADTLAAFDTAEASYNRGNALAKAGKLQEAIAAYDRTLELDPEHADARYNRDLLQKYLEDNPEQQQQPQPQNQGEGEQEQQGDSNQSSGGDEQQNGEQAADEQSSDGEQGENGQSQQAQGDGTEDSAEPEEEGEQQEQEQQAAEAGEQTEDDGGEAAPGPQDVEQWASEQAAEQWLRRVPQDPGGLLRRKFLYQYQRLGVDQEGNPVAPRGAGQRDW
jgi:Ca-activated chloride channel family protein